MRVVVHQVGPHVARPDGAQDRVHVGAVEVEQGAPVVQQSWRSSPTWGSNSPTVFGVGDHEHGGLVVELGLEVVEVDEPAAVALDRDRLEPGEVGRGGVGAVGAVGDQDLGPPLAPVAEVGRGDQQRRQLALRPAAGCRLTASSPAISASISCSSKRIASSPWSVLSSWYGCCAARARQRREPLVPLRVVLHRARPERVEVRVDRHVQRRKVRVVPDDVELAQLGQRRRLPRSMRAGISSSSGRSGTSESGRIAVARPGRLDLEEQRGWSSLYITLDVPSFMRRNRPRGNGSRG